MTDYMLGMLTQILLPMFIVALLFSLVGVDPTLVVKGATSIVVAIIGGFFALSKTIFAALFGIKRGGTGTRGKRPS